MKRRSPYNGFLPELDLRVHRFHEGKVHNLAKVHTCIEVGDAFFPLHIIAGNRNSHTNLRAVREFPSGSFELGINEIIASLSLAYPVCRHGVSSLSRGPVLRPRLLNALRAYRLIEP